MRERILDILKNHINVIGEIKVFETIGIIEDVVTHIVGCYNRNGKVLFCGNGGSAADAQHLAAELSGKFYKDREPLFAEALHTNTSFITAVANDYGYETIFSRAVQAKGNKGDVLVGLTTSGTSSNIRNAFNMAHTLGMTTVGFTGNNNNLDKICDYVIKIPSNDTARIQEAHILIGHIICELVEDKLF